MSEEEKVTVLVRCSFTLPVQVPRSLVDDGLLHFDLEENGCPGTGLVWAELEPHIDRHINEGTCWACALQGKNEIVKVGD